MSELKLEGKLIKIFDTNQISDSFKKREFVIETDDKYPQMVKFELTQDNCNILDKYNIGDTVNVYFNIRGREWMNKNNDVVYFVSLNAWRIEQIGTATVAPAAVSEVIPDIGADELPF
jgi:hypothetical protein